MVNFSFKDHYGIEDLVEIVRLLRAPGGCPWDREQDHHSIRKNLIEETYEVAEAIDSDDSDALREELGDLLLQVALHAQMEQEKNAFGFDDVCDEICQKLIVRHPHVFGETRVSGTQDVLKNWDAIKQRTKGQTTGAETLESVPKTLPALMRAEKVQHRAEKAGMRQPDLEWALGDLESEVAELREAVSQKTKADMLEEAGDILFAVVNVSRFLGADAEELLTASTEKFIGRFAEAEKEAVRQGKDMKTCTNEELGELWRCAKEH